MPAASRMAIGTALVALWMLPPVSGQVRAQRDVGAPRLGAVAGRVDLESDGQRVPLRRATVALKRDRGDESWTTATDGDGRFQFEDVIAGSYRVQATKAGFVPAASNGASLLMPVEVKDGAALTVNLAMQRAGAIEGRFLDDRGSPIARLTVTADRLPDGAATEAGSYSAKTDDLGRFRVHTLPRGRYRVHATPPPPASGEKLFYPSILTIAAGQTLDHLEFTVPTAPLSPIAAAAVSAFASDTTNAPPSPGATAQMSGRITRSDTGQPVPNATAELASAPVSVASGQFTFPSIRRVASADADGRFQFNNLPAGNYTVTATAEGFADGEGFTGWQPPPRAPIMVKAGDRASRDLVLTPTSAIEVRVLDEFGDPAPGVVLQISQQVSAAGASRFLPGAGVAVADSTDDRGWFRVYGLFPGDYYLHALPEPFGRSGPAAFAMTFFPGTTSALAATPVRLSAGRDALDVTFPVRTANTAAISGLAVDNAGRPVADAQVLLLPTPDAEVRAPVFARTTTGVDGRFVYPRVPEGTYVLQASGSGVFGSAPAMVSQTADRNAHDMRLILKPRTTARGRIVFEGDIALPQPGPETMISFQPTDFTMGPAGGNRIETRLTSNWNFEIPSLAWHGLITARGSAGWALARVVVQGRDITYTPYDFQSADVDGIEVIFTSRVGRVAGAVVTAGQPVADSLVVVFGADAATWMHLALTLRRGVTNAEGVFSIGDLLPGRYLALALPGPSRQILDPTSLLALRSVATPLVVSEGATATVRLTVVK